MSGVVTVSHLVARADGRLTPSERRLADTIIDDPTTLAFGTVADLARRADTSGPTVVRFATKLGFAGYSALQERARQLLAEQLKRPTDRIRLDGDDSSWRRARSAAMNSVGSAFDAVGSEGLARLATPLVEAPGRVWVVASDHAAAGVVLTTGLGLLRPGVVGLGGSAVTVAAALADAGPDDVALVIDMARYETAVLQTTRLLVDEQVPVVVITDDPRSPLVGLAEVFCALDIPAAGPFDSVLPTIAVAEVIVAQVAHRLREAATDRLDRTEALWHRVGVFEQETGP